MKNDELDQILRSARVPERDSEYWAGFPGRVAARIQEEGWLAGPRRSRAVSGGWLAVGWGCRLREALRQRAVGFALVLICVGLGFAAGFWRGRLTVSSGQGQLAEAQKCFREVAALFPNQVRAIVFDPQGIHLVLSEKADVPASPPLYVKVTGPKGCQRFVTFSGQQIRLDGDIFEVLCSRQGEVLLVGEQRVWSSSRPSENEGRYRIEAGPLRAAAPRAGDGPRFAEG